MTLDDLRTLLAQATPGPWRNDSGNGQIESRDRLYFRALVCERPDTYCIVSKRDPRYETCPDAPRIDPEADMEFIAAARSALPVLIEIAETCLQYRDAESDAALRDAARRHHAALDKLRALR